MVTLSKKCKATKRRNGQQQRENVFWETVGNDWLTTFGRLRFDMVCFLATGKYEMKNNSALLWKKKCNFFSCAVEHFSWAVTSAELQHQALGFKILNCSRRTSLMKTSWRMTRWSADFKGKKGQKNDNSHRPSCTVLVYTRAIRQHFEAVTIPSP